MTYYHINKESGELSFTSQPLASSLKYAYLNITSHGVAQKLANSWQAFMAEASKRGI